MAAEIDSVTPRHLKLENAITEINKIMNQRIIAAIKNANPNSRPMPTPRLPSKPSISAHLS